MKIIATKESYRYLVHISGEGSDALGFIADLRLSKRWPPFPYERFYLHGSWGEPTGDEPSVEELLSLPEDGAVIAGEPPESDAASVAD
jgi:hypothetical protein